MTEIDIYYEGKLSTRCVHRENNDTLITDAPKDNHGRGEKFSPTDLLAVALGSCVLTVMGIFAERNQVDLSGARVTVSKEMQNAPSRRIGRVKVVFYCPRTFSPEMTERLEKVATTCPVHHSLHPEVNQEFIFNWGAP